MATRRVIRSTPDRGAPLDGGTFVRRRSCPRRGAGRLLRSRLCRVPAGSRRPSAGPALQFRKHGGAMSSSRAKRPAWVSTETARPSDGGCRSCRAPCRPGIPRSQSAGTAGRPAPGDTNANTRSRGRMRTMSGARATYGPSNSSSRCHACAMGSQARSSAHRRSQNARYAVASTLPSGSLPRRLTRIDGK